MVYRLHNNGTDNDTPLQNEFELIRKGRWRGTADRSHHAGTMLLITQMQRSFRFPSTASRVNALFGPIGVVDSTIPNRRHYLPAVFLPCGKLHAECFRRISYPLTLRSPDQDRGCSRINGEGGEQRVPIGAGARNPRVVLVDRLRIAFVAMISTHPLV